MAVAGTKPGDGYTKTSRSSIVVESGTLAYSPQELAAFSAARAGAGGSGAYTSNPPFTINIGGSGFTDTGSGYPSTGGGQISGYICQALQFFGYPCTTAGLGQATRDGVNLFGGGSDPNNQPGAAASCPDGYQVNPQTGICEKSGTMGAVQRYLPGGQTGTMADIYGQAVVGAFGIPALVPAQVGTITRRDGTVNSVLRCPPGAVLGKDSLCYQKGTIAKKFRKWPPPSTRCPISPRDWKAIKSIGRVQKTIRKVAGEAGMTAKKR